MGRPPRLSAEDAVTLLRSFAFKPVGPYPGQDKRWEARHLRCGRVCRVRLTVLKTARGTGCAACSSYDRSASIAAATSEKRVQEAMADMRAAGLDPQEPYPGAGYPWPSIHLPCGRRVAPRLSSVRRGSNGCRSCANRAQWERYWAERGI